MQNNFSWDLDCPYIAHYGVPHGQGPNGGSGRYPWGSGEKWRKIRAGVKNAGDKIKKFFGGKNRVDTSALPKNWDQMTPAERAEWSNKHQDALLKGESSTQKLTSEDSTPKTETPSEPAKTDKKTALESGSREEILKVFQESSNEEIQRAINKAQLMDSLNKSIEDARPKQTETKTPEQMAKEERADYIKEALGSGDYNRIMEVATDKSVSNQDLQNALNKMSTIQSAQEKNSASTKFFENADKFKNAVDKTLGYYDTAANVWNTIAVNYNNTANVKGGKSQPLGLLLTVPKNNNQQKQNNQNNNNQQNQQQGPPKPQQNQNQQNNQNNQQQNPQPQAQQNNQPKSNPQPKQTQPTQKQQTQAAPKQETKKESNYEDMDWFTDKVASQKARDSFYKATQKKMSDDSSANKKTNNDGWTVDEKNYKNFNEAYSKVSTLLLTDNLTINKDDLFKDLKHSSLGDEVFEFVAHYGVPHGKGPGRGSGRYAWGSGEKNKKDNSSFGKMVASNAKNSKNYLKNIPKEGINPWDSPKQMELLLDMANNSKKYYESQLNSSNKGLATLAKQVLDKPIKSVEFLENHKDGKMLLGWYSRLALKKRDEYSQKIYGMKLDSKPDQDLIDFMLMLASSNNYMHVYV